MTIFRLTPHKFRVLIIITIIFPLILMILIWGLFWSWQLRGLSSSGGFFIVCFPFKSLKWPMHCVLSLWGKIIIPLVVYMAYMDYMDRDVICSRKAVKLNHTLSWLRNQVFRHSIPLLQVGGALPHGWLVSFQQLFTPATNLTDHRAYLGSSTILSRLVNSIPA